jgi:hypothetical protein
LTFSPEIPPTVSNSDHRRFDLESLEQRLLLSADGFGIGIQDDRLEQENENSRVVVEMTPEVTAEAQSGAEEDSIFGDFAVEIVFGDDTSGEWEETAVEGQNDAESITPSVQEVLTPALPESVTEAVAGPAVEDQMNAGQAPQQNPAEVVPDGSLDEAVADDLEGSGNPVPEMIVETLHAANGPPAVQALTGISDGESIINLNPETVQTIGNELVIYEGETLKGTWSAPIALIQNGGRVSPGNSPGIQNVASYTLLSGELEMEIAGAASGGAGVTYDQLQVTGLATLGGSGRLRITLLGGYQPPVGQIYPIITWGSVTGEFENYLGTAAIGFDRAFIPVYSAGGLSLQVVATPNAYDLIKTDVENVITQLGEVGERLDTAGDFAEDLPFIGEKVGDLVSTVSAIQGVLLDKLNDLGAVSAWRMSLNI